ncbi:MAG: hypothetical protein RLZZ312_1525 [Bacteroidota bacterium]|jgi:GNAT superfamily N-acetyltransferase
MIELKTCVSKREMTQFVKFPFLLYKNHPYWVPPIIADELETFDKTKNPVFENSEAEFFLAYQNNKIVGRIAAIINWQEVKTQQKPKIRFGWFDVIDDIMVTKTLLEKVFEIGRNNNLSHAEGPMGFSNLDKVGCITEGFDSIGSMITWYNYPYYKSHFEQLGFAVEKEYLENRMLFSNIKPIFFEKAAHLIAKRYELTTLSFTKTKDILPFVDEMFDLFNASYASLSSFVAISESEKAFFKKKYISFINPEYILFVQDKNRKLVAFSIVMPSFAEALQKAKGKLWPFGIFYLLKARKHSKDVLFYLIGVAPEAQNKGIHALIFDQYFKTFAKKRIINCIRTPELSDNIAIAQLWKNFQPETFRKRCTFRKDI